MSGSRFQTAGWELRVDGLTSRQYQTDIRKMIPDQIWVHRPAVARTDVDRVPSTYTGGCHTEADGTSTLRPYTASSQRCTDSPCPAGVWHSFKKQP